MVTARSLEEVKGLLKDNLEINSEQVWSERQKRHFGKAEKLDLNELDSISGGADRDWQKDGRTATCEIGSWCGSNDKCIIWDVAYCHFCHTCPDDHEHVFEDYVCVRCGSYCPSSPIVP